MSLCWDEDKAKLKCLQEELNQAHEQLKSQQIIIVSVHICCHTHHKHFLYHVV